MVMVRTGIQITNSNTNDVLIQDCLVGLRPDGSPDGNDGEGILIRTGVQSVTISKLYHISEFLRWDSGRRKRSEN